MSSPAQPFWVTAFLDSSAGHHAASVTFWSAATGYRPSEVRGETGEFASLLPPVGDAYLKTQRLDDGPDRIHVDLHVTDPRAAADRAVALGAQEVADPGLGYVVLRSPGGLTLCLVSHPAHAGPPQTSWPPDGHDSRVVLVAIDAPPAVHDRELAFWSDLTGWAPRRSEHEELHFLGEDRPLGLLVQRLGPGESGPVRAHLDWGTTDRAAETERHVGLGATVRGVYRDWTVLEDPTGRPYCLTDQDPR